MVISIVAFLNSCFVVRPVTRPQGVESGGGASPFTSREALLAVAGVHIVGQSKRSPLLEKY